ncbi:MAG: HdeD family acid-resistance protein [Acetobacterium sp.]
MNEIKVKMVGIDLLERVYGKWWLMLLDGLILIALCAVTILNSNLALTFLVFVFGVYRGLMGVVYIVSALITKSKYGSSMGFTLGHGIFDLVVGAIFLLVPEVIVTFFIIIIGLWAIMTGIFLLVISGSSNGLGKSTKVVIGVALIIFGIYSFFDPFGLASFFVLIVGLVLGIFGFFLVLQSFSMRKYYLKMKEQNKGYDDYKID